MVGSAIRIWQLAGNRDVDGKICLMVVDGQQVLTLKDADLIGPFSPTSNAAS